jgi:hypothetical protein
VSAAPTDCIPLGITYKFYSGAPHLLDYQRDFTIANVKLITFLTHTAASDDVSMVTVFSYRPNN